MASDVGGRWRARQSLDAGYFFFFFFVRPEAASRLSFVHLHSDFIAEPKLTRRPARSESGGGGKSKGLRTDCKMVGLEGPLAAARGDF